MNIGELKMPTPEELANEKKKYMLSDAELLKEGAEVCPNGTVYPTENQIEVAKKEMDDKNEFTQVAKNELFPLISEASELQEQIWKLELERTNTANKIMEIEENYTLASEERDERPLNEIFNDIKLPLRFYDPKHFDLSDCDLVSEFSRLFGDNFNHESFLKRLKIENFKKNNGKETADILFDGKLIIDYYNSGGDSSRITGEFHEMFIKLALEQGVRKIEK